MRAHVLPDGHGPRTGDHALQRLGPHRRPRLHAPHPEAGDHRERFRALADDQGADLQELGPAASVGVRADEILLRLHELEQREQAIFSAQRDAFLLRRGDNQVLVLAVFRRRGPGLAELRFGNGGTSHADRRGQRPAVALRHAGGAQAAGAKRLVLVCGGWGRCRWSGRCTRAGGAVQMAQYVRIFPKARGVAENRVALSQGRGRRVLEGLVGGGGVCVRRGRGQVGLGPRPSTARELAGSAAEGWRRRGRGGLCVGQPRRSRGRAVGGRRPGGDRDSGGRRTLLRRLAAERSDLGGAFGGPRHRFCIRGGARC
mmetsp:Transcript_136998/g.438283  ORF Transcript_136998/g.438283 Transcript_136998/m.438283 type:complete len:314 (-) Transcript_136998:256-1197(-)